MGNLNARKPINPIPYKPTKNNTFSGVSTLLIHQKLFDDTFLIPGESVFTFENCVFDKLKIENYHEIAFGLVSINFIRCYIKELEVDHIFFANISLGFHCSYLSGRIQSNNIQEVSLDTCVLEGELSLVDQKFVRINFINDDVRITTWDSFLKEFAQKLPAGIFKLGQLYRIRSANQIYVGFKNFRDQTEGLALGGKSKEKEPLVTNVDIASQEISMIIDFSSSTSEERTVIENANLKRLRITGRSKGSIEVVSSKVDQLCFNGFNPEGEVVFYDVSPINPNLKDSLLEFRVSNLDKVKFDNFNFDEYSLVSFYRSRFAKATFSSCSFPKTGTSFEKFKTLKSATYKGELPANYYKDQYEIYLQLKNSMESVGNIYEAQKLQAISIDALRKVPDVSRWDKAILWINRWSNNHGLSILNPLGGFIAFSVILYVFYLVSLGRILNGGSFDPTLIGYYFSFIDITHRQDFLVEKGQLTGWAMTIDFIGKLIVGFFAYQFVAAFRKYGKR